MIKNLYLNDTIQGFNNPAGVTRMVVDTATGKTSVIVRGRQIELSNETLSAALKGDIDTLSTAIRDKVIGLETLRNDVDEVSGLTIGIIDAVQDATSGLLTVNNRIDVIQTTLSDSVTGLANAHARIDIISGDITNATSGIQALNNNYESLKQELYEEIGSTDFGSVSSRLDTIEQVMIPETLLSAKAYTDELKDFTIKRSEYMIHYKGFSEFAKLPWNKAQYEANINTIKNALPIESWALISANIIQTNSLSAAQYGDVYSVTDDQNQLYIFNGTIWQKWGLDACSENEAAALKNALQNEIDAVSGAIQSQVNSVFKFKGNAESAQWLINLELAGTAKPGDVYQLNNLEYVYTDNPQATDVLSGSSHWVELGSSSQDLYSKIDKLNVDLTSEANRAKANQNYLSGAIDTEVTRATTAESTLTTSISNEETRAKAAETALDVKLTGMIDTEVTRATTVESTLATSISTEATTARAAEAELRNSIVELSGIDRQDLTFKGLSSYQEILKKEEDHANESFTPSLRIFDVAKGDFYIMPDNMAIINTTGEHSTDMSSWSVIGISGYTRDEIDAKVSVINQSIASAEANAQSANDTLSTDITNAYQTFVGQVSADIDTKHEAIVNDIYTELSGMDSKISAQVDIYVAASMETVSSNLIDYTDQQIIELDNKISVKDIHFKGFVKDLQTRLDQEAASRQNSRYYITANKYDLYILTGDLEGRRAIINIANDSKDDTVSGDWQYIGLDERAFENKLSSYTDTKITELKEIASADATAKEIEAINSGKTYTDEQIINLATKAAISATTYTDQQINGLSATAKGYTETYATEQANVAITSAKTYTDGEINFVSGAIIDLQNNKEDVTGALTAIETLSTAFEELNKQDVNFKGIITESKFITNELYPIQYGWNPVSGDLWFISGLSNVPNKYIARIYDGEGVWREIGVSGYYSIPEIDTKFSNAEINWNTKAETERNFAITSATTVIAQEINALNTDLNSTINSTAETTLNSAEGYTDTVSGNIISKVNSDVSNLQTIIDKNSYCAVHVIITPVTDWSVEDFRTGTNASCIEIEDGYDVGDIVTFYKNNSEDFIKVGTRNWKELGTDLNTISTLVKTEETRAKAVEETNATNISNQITRSTNVDKFLSGSIDYVSAVIDQNNTILTDKIETLSTNINADLISNVNTLTTNITNAVIECKDYTYSNTSTLSSMVEQLSATYTGEIAGVFHFKGSVDNFYQLDDVMATTDVQPGDVYTVLTAVYDVTIPAISSYAKYGEGADKEYGVEFVRGDDTWCKLGYQNDMSKFQNKDTELETLINEQTNRAITQEEVITGLIATQSIRAIAKEDAISGKLDSSVTELTTAITTQATRVDNNFYTKTDINNLKNYYDSIIIGLTGVISDLSGQLDEVKQILELAENIK